MQVWFHIQKAMNLVHGIINSKIKEKNSLDHFSRCMQKKIWQNPVSIYKKKIISRLGTERNFNLIKGIYEKLTANIMPTMMRYSLHWKVYNMTQMFFFLLRFYFIWQNSETDNQFISSYCPLWRRQFSREKKSVTWGSSTIFRLYTQAANGLVLKPPDPKLSETIGESERKLSFQRQWSLPIPPSPTHHLPHSQPK